MFRRLLSDKTIGRRLYHVEHKKWEKYNRDIHKIYKSDYSHDEIFLKQIDNALADSIVQHTKEITNLKQDIFHIFSRLNELTKDVKMTVSNSEQLEKRFVVFSFEVRNRLDKDDPKI
jgi:archaellum component FlaC